MAGFHKIKTGTSVTSWDYYVTDNSWLKRNLVTDTAGVMYESDCISVIHSFPALHPLRLRSTKTKMLGRSKYAAVIIDGKRGYIPIRRIQKPQCGSRKVKTQSQQEQQERFVIKTINFYAKGGPITVSGSNGFEIPNIVSAAKYGGLNRHGKQQYADIVLKDKNNQRILISMKEFDAPSLFGGGLTQLKEAGTPYLKRITLKAFAASLKDRRFKLLTNRRTDIYIRLKDREWIKKAIIGSKPYGGPCDYIFIGPKFPKVTFEDYTLTFGEEGAGKQRTARFYSPDELMKLIPNPYLRIRSRGEDARQGVDTKPIFVPEKDTDGIPLFWVKKLGSTERARFVVAMKADPNSANYLTIDG